MGSSPEHSTSSCESACDVSEGNSQGDLFQIGQKYLFSLSSISLSAEELEGLTLEEAKGDEITNRKAPKGELESETPVAEVSTSDSQGEIEGKSDSQWRGFLRKLKKGPVGFNPFHPSMPSFPSLPSIKKISRKKSRNITQSLPSLPPNLDSQFCHCFEASWKNFTLPELQTATDNFSHDNLIGEGGYSEVYKGHLQDGKLVAIKRLTRGSPEEMTADYLSELGILVHVNHPNIASVIGYGVEGGMHLILPLSPHGSLASLLNGEKEKLTWGSRYNIAVGIASGLAYLHEGCQRRIIHRDIKAANVLLTEDFEPQISDFGLAKWLPDQWSHLNVSQFEGTFGYLPPEFFLHGTVDEKTDVYAFGVLMLELLSGRPALDKSNNSVVMWAKPFLISKNVEGLLDPSLGGVYDAEQLNRIVMVASLCIQQSSTERPQMSQVVRMLKGDEGFLQSKKKFQKRPALRRTYPLELYTIDESMPCVNDAGQQNEVAVEQ
ncbi:receptor-like cytosolic serine/threonine-protein kinase RBK2 [Coffea arabica]|uniref:non-specific serine/threonine protein kinase n=1 Tax=Coffea arabica TaxID=13443 RepID=A0A6P6WL03_COFAR|nr:receptor-like cytosolic serine/threonine-protein kinase RBK2 [Coffea arabica]XP_027121175.1 receptor-like cytosolic serine/threonine-protein kinase RBK2 [Coffea arabica]